ncbi:MAG: carbamoyltransferase HypF [Parvularcula sp.]
MDQGELIIVRGQVQGVGFRPTVYRLATELGLTGDVRNTADGVHIRLWGNRVGSFVDRLQAEAPPLAQISGLDRSPVDGDRPIDFAIRETTEGKMRVAVTPDAATCPDCLAEIDDPTERRYHYPFANCTNCGPRFSIIYNAPYDRAKTSMKGFDLCPSCKGEYNDPLDRRYHAQPIACPDCGPRIWLERLSGEKGGVEDCGGEAAIDAVASLLADGDIVAIKGLGGFHLACDATNKRAVERLRRKKRRREKAFALMARDIGVVKTYAHVSPEEEAVLRSAAAPVVLLKIRTEAQLPDVVAPGLDRLGFMLPYTPLHHLVLRNIDAPLVMTSGNISGEPQCTTNEQARNGLESVAEAACMADRDIVNRIDDSVVRVDLGTVRMLRRARGYAPSAIPLPLGLAETQPILALGADLKNAFCLTKDGAAIVSQHMGDLDDPATADDVMKNLALYQDLYEFQPKVIVVDQHPEYRSSKHGRKLATDLGAALVEVQHHHAHIASCMAENEWPDEEKPLLGIALDGTGWGGDGTVWGGEFLQCTYRSSRRLASFQPVALPGGDAAAREPWRNAYVQIIASMGWDAFRRDYKDLDIHRLLCEQPLATLEGMIEQQINSPLTSSCGRLFDAAAAIMGLAEGRQSYEGHAAMLLEAVMSSEPEAENLSTEYQLAISDPNEHGLRHLVTAGLIRSMLDDLNSGVSVGVISARFHRAVAQSVVQLAEMIAREKKIDTVALSGGCFQNKALFEHVFRGLTDRGLAVLTHKQVPANDGGIALGQAVIAAALEKEAKEGNALCV